MHLDRVLKNVLKPSLLISVGNCSLCMPIGQQRFDEQVPQTVETTPNTFCLEHTAEESLNSLSSTTPQAEPLAHSVADFVPDFPPQFTILIMPHHSAIISGQWSIEGRFMALVYALIAVENSVLLLSIAKKRVRTVVACIASVLTAVSSISVSVVRKYLHLIFHFRTFVISHHPLSLVVATKLHRANDLFSDCI